MSIRRTRLQEALAIQKSYLEDIGFAALCRHELGSDLHCHSLFEMFMYGAGKSAIESICNKISQQTFDKAQAFVSRYKQSIYDIKGLDSIQVEDVEEIQETTVQDTDWLLQACKSLDHAIPNELLAVQISEILATKDDIQSELLDLLGMSESSFAFIQNVLERHSSSPKMAHSDLNHPVFAPASRSSGAVLQSVRIESDGKRRVALPDVNPGARPAGTSEVHVKHTRITGPGTGNEEEPDKGQYIVVHIPAPLKKDNHGLKLVPVSAFGSFGQVAFENINKLNRLQSAVFSVAYHTNHNMLICAPTGAGKTNVAMTAVVRELERNADDILATKIIYVAPMKALAQEVVDTFSARLKKLGVKVRELTGDMQLTKTEIQATQLIVTTPEKWDVITRKSGDGTLVEAVGLLIIDEVHLVGEDRGPVIESLVARTLRMVEQKQKMVRIVGLSATLPNYRDVAHFLRVDSNYGLFFFDNSFRPVPLEQTFIGVIEKNVQKKLAMLNDIAFEKAVDSINRGHQVMIFVHSRKDTVKTARAFLEAAQRTGCPAIFRCESNSSFDKAVGQSRNAEVRQLFASGLGIHHAGMLRPDRSLTERMFSQQAISVLFCTATLAWGVNLPVHTVVIKGTQIYVPEKGGLVELNMQDVMQCFGRAGRPQFDTSGEAILITEQGQLNRYLSMLNHALPLESQLDKHLPDALNAEIVSGTVTNMGEAVEWLSYTFLHIRMMLNPMRYGITYKEKESDPTLLKRRSQMIIAAARQLDDCRMSRFARLSTNMESPLGVTDMGRIASHYYIGHGTIDTFNQKLKQQMTDEEVIDLLCHASEFASLRVREEELSELAKLRRSGCALELLSPIDSPRGKAAVLLQCYITRSYVASFTLSSDMNYIAQNMGRVARAVFEICLKKRWASMSEQLLRVCIALDKRCWWIPFGHPLRQFSPMFLPGDIVKKLEEGGAVFSLENLLEKEVMVGHAKMGEKIKSAARKIPYLQVEAKLQPLTRSILRVSLDIYADFEWSDRVHGKIQGFWIWIGDQNSEWIYHSERLMIRKQDHVNKQEFTIPVFEPLPSHYYLHIYSDSWLGSDYVVSLNLNQLVLPEKVRQHTDLLMLDPLPRSSLQNPSYELMYANKFTHFNPIQTQIFHMLYHTDNNVLLGAPTGSGKTLSCELGILRNFNMYPGTKVVYIAPLKALVSERVKDWKETLGKQLGKRVVEFTGDVSPDPYVLRNADVVITTPEKWDGASRMWKVREYVQMVKLVIIDEIHLLGEERGAVLEVIVTRMRRMMESMNTEIRFIGLSTALANAHDLGNWLGIKKDNLGLFNFRPAVRPVPLEAHIQGFPGVHYCPRMATMNKPAYQAILTHSPSKPVLIFVASRRQTRLTALDLISLCAASDVPRRFLHTDFEIMEAISSDCKDDTLKHTLAFGIGIHHAGLNSKDRDIVENLFVSGQIQVLVCTSTLAWGVNFPAHLVIVKGTEYFDAKTKRYQPFPVTDVLQMMGRAGRPQFDDHAVAMIFVEESLKEFYKKFLYEPFPVESHLPEFIHNHINAEIASGTITDRKSALDYLSWTYFFRRLPKNPSYYGGTEKDFLVDMITKVFKVLDQSGCINSTSSGVSPTRMGKIASFYYLDHRTIAHFQKFNFKNSQNLLILLAGAHEFSEVPVRHKEDVLNTEFAQLVPWDPYPHVWKPDHPAGKTFLILQAHCKRIEMPTKDFTLDSKSVLDQVPRVISAFIESCTSLKVAICAISIAQSIASASWIAEPHFKSYPENPPNIGPCWVIVAENDVIQSIKYYRKIPRFETTHSYTIMAATKKSNFTTDRHS